MPPAGLGSRPGRCWLPRPMGCFLFGAARSGSWCWGAWRGSVWDGASEWCSLRWLERPASRELLVSSEMGERGSLDLGRRPFRRDSFGLTGARWCWPFFLGRGGGKAAAGGGCGAGVSAAPDPDLKASVYFNQGCLRWSCFGRPLSPELYLFGGWRWEVAPEKSEGTVPFLKAPSRLPPSPLPSTQLVCWAKAQILVGSSDSGAPGVVTLLGVSFVVSLGWM